MNNTDKQNDTWLSRWDDRYASDEFAYGEDPNIYLKQQLALLKPGSILFPAEGEGRNAVYAAKLGWAVTAFDISEEGRKKAIKLASKNNLSIDYHIGKLEELNYEPGQFDAMGLIYAHFPANIKSIYHRKLDKLLKVDGIMVFEAFSKRHIEYVAANPKVGGPKDLESLFSTDEILADFPNYEIIEIKETEIELNEGVFHNGTGSVIRFVGRKISNI